MKKSLYFIFTILFSIIFINVVNASDETLTFSRTTTNNIENIVEIISKKDGYLISEITNLNNTKIYNYNNEDNLISTKELENLINTKIIKVNENYLVVGVTSNTLKIYLLDSNLQVIEQKETSYMIDQSSIINLYKNDDKILVLLTENGELSSINVYEIDNELNVLENRFSSYDSTYLKAALKGDYYLISNNNFENETRIIKYNNSTYNENKIILIGTSSNINYDMLIGYDEKAHITIKDYENNIIVDEDNSDYLRFIDIELIKDKLFILAEKIDGTYLVTYSIDGKILSEINIKNAKYLQKVSNQLVIVTKEDINALIHFYEFNCVIKSEENILGTLKVVENAKPYEKVTLSVTPNSGYELESITVKDSQGNIINLVNNTFVMPENDVSITTNYIETLSNPETVDIIFIISFLAFLISITIIFLYRKLRWLK